MSNYSKDYLEQQIKVIKYAETKYINFVPIKNKKGHTDIVVMLEYFVEDNANLVDVYFNEKTDFNSAPKFKLNKDETTKFCKIANHTLHLAVKLFKKHRVFN